MRRWGHAPDFVRWLDRGQARSVCQTQGLGAPKRSTAAWASRRNRSLSHLSRISLLRPMGMRKIPPPPNLMDQERKLKKAYGGQAYNLHLTRGFTSCVFF